MFLVKFYFPYLSRLNFKQFFKFMVDFKHIQVIGCMIMILCYFQFSV